MRAAYVRCIVLCVVMWQAVLLPQEQGKKPVEVNRSPADSVTVPAKTIDFNAQFASGNYALENLGIAIDKGRRFADPSALLSAAVIIALEESRTGKTATLSSATLIAEALRLARAQLNIDVLKQIEVFFSVSALGNNPAEAANVAGIINYAENLLASTRGPGAKIIDIKVENFSDHGIYVYIDDLYRGYVPSGNAVVFNNVGKGWTTVYAETDNVWDDATKKYTFQFWKNTYNLQEYDLTMAADFTWSVY